MFCETLNNKMQVFFSSYSQLLTICLIVICTIVLLIILKVVCKNYVKKQVNAVAIKMVKYLSVVVGYIFIITAVLIILQTLGIKINSLLVGLGLIILIVGIASKKEIANVAAGFMICINKSFYIDEIIEVNGFKGKVIEINLRSIKILHQNGDLKIINNSNIDSLINYSRFPHVVIIDTAIDVNENIDKVINILDENLIAIKDNFHEVQEGPNVIGVIDCDERKVVIRTVIKTLPEQYYEVERSTKRYIQELLVRKEIKLPKVGD